MYFITFSRFSHNWNGGYFRNWLFFGRREEDLNIWICVSVLDRIIANRPYLHQQLHPCLLFSCEITTSPLFGIYRKKLRRFESSWCRYFFFPSWIHYTPVLMSRANNKDPYKLYEQRIYKGLAVWVVLTICLNTGSATTICRSLCSGFLCLEVFSDVVFVIK